MEAIRATIHAAVPGTTECISYQMPTFRLHDKPLLHVAAWKKHIGMYPVPDGDDDLLASLAPFAAEKGTLRFPLDTPLPLDLVARVATARATQVRREAD